MVPPLLRAASSLLFPLPVPTKGPSSPTAVAMPSPRPPPMAQSMAASGTHSHRAGLRGDSRVAPCRQDRLFSACPLSSGSQALPGEAPTFHLRGHQLRPLSGGSFASGGAQGGWDRWALSGQASARLVSSPRRSRLIRGPRHTLCQQERPLCTCLRLLSPFPARSEARPLSGPRFLSQLMVVKVSSPTPSTECSPRSTSPCAALSAGLVLLLLVGASGLPGSGRVASLRGFSSSASSSPPPPPLPPSKGSSMGSASS